MTPEHTSVTAFAPATVGNVAVGFDILGHALDAVGDRVTLRRIGEPMVRIASIGGSVEPLPTNSAANTATAGLVRLIEDHRLPFGFEVTLEKGIPISSGMGGSAASAVGAAVAANAFLASPLPPERLLSYALVGEAVASGSRHGDNLAPCLLGGLVLVRSLEPADLVRIPVPATIRCVLVHPRLRVETRTARQVLPREVPLHSSIEQSANLAGFLAGCYSGDLELIHRSLSDVLVEPHRQALVPGFQGVKRAAMQSGALGCSLSGAGPSLFAWCADEEVGREVCDRMIDAFAAEGIAAEGWISRIDVPGARVVETA
ncbi:MAG: homoserine kinase [Longimicrobiaceae bacterium]